MFRINAQLLACWLALAGFLLANCLGPRGILLCTDSSGSTRLELGCAGDLGVDCRTLDEHANQSPSDSKFASDPCTDTQLRANDNSAQPPTRTDLIPPALFLAVLYELSPVLAEPQSGFEHIFHTTPQETQLHLRSVVLVI